MNVKAILKVVWNTIKDSLSGKMWKWLLSSAGAFSAILHFGENFMGTTIEKSIFYGIFFILGLFMLRFLLFLCINSAKYLHSVYRESKYGDAIIFLKEGFAKAHAYRGLDENNKTEKAFKEVMTTLCDSVQKSFNGKNFCECSVSIKVPIQGALTGQASVMNLCRDREHCARDTPTYKAIDHTIIGNTAFHKVLNRVTKNDPKGFYYLNNDIQNTTDYDNTSSEAYSNGILPYNSELVVPIIPTERDASKIYDTLGFLCVDCIKKEKFDPKYDVPLIEGVADGIYDILKNKINTQNYGS